MAQGFNPEDNVFTATSTQSDAIKTLISSLKDIILEANICITPDGISIKNVDEKRKMLVNLNLMGDRFEYYGCAKNTIMIGVHMGHLYKLISMLKACETFTMYIQKCHYHEGVVSHLTLLYKNTQKDKTTVHELKLIDTDNEMLPQLPPINFSTVINFASAEFQTIVHNCRDLGEHVDICSVGNTLTFTVDGPFSKSTFVCSEGDNDVTKFASTQSSDKIIQNRFSLKYLHYFEKCTNLGKELQICMDNDMPLVVNYNVSALGTLQLCLSPLPPCID